MPPRYAYWTILIGDAPTSFRASAQEDLLPTLKRLQSKHPEARMMWWQNGKLWDSRVDAQEAMIARGELGRKGDVRQRDARQGGGFRDRGRPRPSFDGPREERDASGKLDWTPKSQAPSPKPQEKLGWKPKGEFTPAPPAKPRSEWKPKGSFGSDRPARPDWKSKPRSDRPRRDEKPEWRPKDKSFSSPQAFKPSSPRREARPEWKSKSSDDYPRRSGKPEWSPKSQAPSPKSPSWKPKGSFKTDRPARPEWKSKSRDDGPRRSERPEWKPKDDAPSAPREKRKWIPKEEYKKSLGIEAKRDKNWRPGGAHKDPRQKYKDAKKAKWGRFKEGIRKRWEGKQGAAPRKKKKDDE